MRTIRGERVSAILPEPEPEPALNPLDTLGRQLIETIRLHRGYSPSAAMARSAQLLALIELPGPISAFDW